MPYNTEEVRHAYKSVHNLECENQVILFMITVGEMELSRCKKIVCFFFKITSIHVGDFFCVNCFHSFSIKNKLKKHENVCRIMIIAT